MGSKSNLKVFCFLHVVEGLISLALLLFHIFGFLFIVPNEPTGVQPIFLIIFCAFLLVPAFGVFKISKKKLNLKVDAGSSIAGTFTFIFLSILSMNDVENDPHMTYLTDDEESVHPYFRVNRFQSVSCLVNGLVFFLHATFAIDFIRTKPKDDLSVASDSSEEDVKPLILHFFFEDIVSDVKNVCKCR